MSGVRLGSHPHPTLVMRQKRENSVAYRCGWIDGCYGEPGRFTENRRLAKWNSASDRLDYYRGHRAGREEGRRSGTPLRAS